MAVWYETYTNLTKKLESVSHDAVQAELSFRRSDPLSKAQVPHKILSMH